VNDNPIDVSYKDVNKKYYTIDEVSNILKIDQSKIVFYFEKLNDFLNITSVGMYQLFDDKDIQNLEIVKNLDKEKHMTMKEIREYLENNKPEVMLKKESNNKVDQSVLNIFQTFANALMEQNAKIDIMYKNNLQLVKYQQKMEKELQEQKNMNQKYYKEYKEDNEKLVQELNTIQKEVAITKEIDKKIELYEQQIDEKFEEMNNKIIERDAKIVEDLSKKLLERKKEAEEKSQEQPKSFIERLFGIRK
jgi:DNA-binding transcriptional MerR regulator